MQGPFDDKIGPGTEVAAAESAGERPTVAVETVTLPVWSEAVGTVRSRRTTRVSPRIMATILEIPLEQGDEIGKGDLIARLDDREVQARLAAAKADLSQAQARLLQAESAFERYSRLAKQGAATEEQLEAVTADYEAAKGAVAGATEAVSVAEIVTGYTEIRSTQSGVVAEKLAEPGDLALPGKPLVAIQDPTDLRLEADVREYLVSYVDVGAEVRVVFGPPISAEIETVVEERAPEADPATRTFRVKAPLPEGTAARPGNFGRLRFRTGEREVLLVPAAAVRRIGQLETVEVVEDGRVRVRHVRTGDRHGERLEVLSGLTAGELVVTGR
jgi:RND family efflux transporter MFP subunit